MKHIKIKNINNISILTISNGQFNTLSIDVLKELDKSLDEISFKKNISSIIITGKGDKAFISGADIKEMQSMSKETASEHSKLGQGIFSKIENFNKPIVAAINGYALGGGCELALACHMRYASDKALIGQPEVKLGLIAGFGGTQRLGKIISKGKAMEVLLSGKMYSSSESLSIGLVDGVFKSDSLIDSVLDILNLISLNAPNAISKTIELVNKSYFLKENDGFNIESLEFGKLFDENESKEGMSAFLEKRKPNFE
jgi:enoyl-CoA hydratase